MECSKNDLTTVSSKYEETSLALARARVDEDTEYKELKIRRLESWLENYECKNWN